jgi:hypothetical protein
MKSFEFLNPNLGEGGLEMDLFVTGILAFLDLPQYSKSLEIKIGMVVESTQFVYNIKIHHSQLDHNETNPR